MSRKSVSAPQNNWFDAENVDDTDLTLEQNFNNQIQTSLIDNHLGSGVLPEALTQTVIFDSALSTGLLDGLAIVPQKQPTDSSYGNQLEVELLNSQAVGKRTVKVVIIGQDFQNNLQYDTLTFAKNETQVTAKHYKSVLVLIFNDFIGPPLQSFNLGGEIVIRETDPLTLSRDPIMVAQDQEPNLIFRDLFTSASTLNNFLTAALPNYNINTLNINTGYRQLRSLNVNDVSSQIGEKFLATTNNIQKITLLLAVSNTVTPANLVWTGNLLISLYQLQSAVVCSSDIVPNLAIDFDPNNIPLAQISIAYNDLLAAGTVLGTVPQPVDFIFSNTSVGSGNSITPGTYYAVTVKRAGSPDTCIIQLATGNNTSTTYRETLFNGSVWVDVPEESLWFQVWTDAAKVSDGQAYDSGQGIQVPKVNENPTTGLTVDYCLDQVPFVNNDLYYALLQADTTTSVPVQDERTGNNINSQKKYTPNLSLLTINNLNNISNVSEPLILGVISDKNLKSSNPGNNVLSAKFHEYGFVNNQIVFKIITDTTDGYRYDPNLNELVAELVNGTLNEAQIIPDIANSSAYYRIAKAELFTMIYGDVDGDGLITTNDLLAAQGLLNDNLNVFPTHAQYITQTTFFQNDSALVWQVYNTSTSTVVASGSDGILSLVSNNGVQANFSSASGLFESITNITACQLVIVTSTTFAGNQGSFDILDVIDNHNLTIFKHYYTSDTILQIFRTNVTETMQVSTTDVSLITNYLELDPTFPPTTSPSNLIGTTFQAVRLTLEAFVDRADDYQITMGNRSTSLHPVPDIYLDGYNFFGGVNVEFNPISFQINKQLTWKDYNLVVNADPRLVPAAFNYASGAPQPPPVLSGAISQSFPIQPVFDPGRNDLFIPNNLVFNNGATLINRDGSFYKVDLEINTVTFIVPPVNFLGEKSFNLLTDFIADYSGTGRTRLFYPAMRFADGSVVGLNAFANNQVRISVALQSVSPLLTSVDGYGNPIVIVDERLGVNVDYSTGLITLQFNNLYQDGYQQTLNTKLQITVNLKKAGWNNTPITITSDRTQNLLGL